MVLKFKTCPLFEVPYEPPAYEPSPAVLMPGGEYIVPTLALSDLSTSEIKRRYESPIHSWTPVFAFEMRRYQVWLKGIWRSYEALAERAKETDNERYIQTCARLMNGLINQFTQVNEACNRYFYTASRPNHQEDWRFKEEPAPEWADEVDGDWAPERDERRKRPSVPARMGGPMQLEPLVRTYGEEHREKIAAFLGQHFEHKATMVLEAQFTPDSWETELEAIYYDAMLDDDSEYENGTQIRTDSAEAYAAWHQRHWWQPMYGGAVGVDFDWDSHDLLHWLWEIGFDYLRADDVVKTSTLNNLCASICGQYGKDHDATYSGFYAQQEDVYINVRRKYFNERGGVSFPSWQAWLDRLLYASPHAQLGEYKVKNFITEQQREWRKLDFVVEQMRQDEIAFLATEPLPEHRIEQMSDHPWVKEFISDLNDDQKLFLYFVAGKAADGSTNDIGYPTLYGCDILENRSSVPQWWREWLVGEDGQYLLKALELLSDHYWVNGRGEKVVIERGAYRLITVEDPVIAEPKGRRAMVGGRLRMSPEIARYVRGQFDWHYKQVAPHWQGLMLYITEDLPEDERGTEAALRWFFGSSMRSLVCVDPGDVAGDFMSEENTRTAWQHTLGSEGLYRQLPGVLRPSVAGMRAAKIWPTAIKALGYVSEAELERTRGTNEEEESHWRAQGEWNAKEIEEAENEVSASNKFWDSGRRNFELPKRKIEPLKTASEGTKKRPRRAKRKPPKQA